MDLSGARSGRIAILSGERGSGKTSACLELIDRARHLGLDCAGLVCPERHEEGQPPGQDVVDVRTGERRRFSVETDEPVEGDRRHRLDQKAAQWASRRLAKACPCDLLVIDEIGPLELERGQGWPNAFDVLRSGDFGLAVVVVRPKHVKEVIERIGERAHGGKPIEVTAAELRDMAELLQAPAGQSTASLERYRQKRDFSVTGEPSGDPARAPAPGHRFVVQRHRATRLHYDFRLEIDGVLMSWAVPKGPTLDPSPRRLAVHVEDHPLDYYDFEGTIPKGEYGGGDVIVWDWGTFELDKPGDPGALVRKGELAFELHGEKLHGIFALVRTGGSAAGEDERNWLLIKKRDAAAVPGWDAEAFPRSVKTGRTNDEVKAGAGAVWHSDRAAPS